MIINSPDLSQVVSLDTFNGNSPIVGWENRVTAASVSASSEADENPAVNLATPSMYSRWVASGAAEQTLQVDLDASLVTDYVAAAVHNLGSASITVALDRKTSLASHNLFVQFNGAGAATSATDESQIGHTLTFNGNAQLDTAQKKWGTASLLCDGTGDYVSISDHSSWNFTGQFTIHCWVRFNGGIGSERGIICQYLGGTNKGFYLLKSGTEKIVFGYSLNGSSELTITGTTSVTTGAWYHVAVTKDSTGTIRLFLNGALEASSASGIGAFFDSTLALTIGALTTAAGYHHGWIDQVEILNGTCLWAAAFTPPAGPGFEAYIPAQTVTDDGPLIVRFTPQQLAGVQLRLSAGDAAPYLGVLYVGRLLQLQRRLYVGHSPLSLNQASTIVNGRSENGQFLGRILLSSASQGAISLQNLTPEWVREHLDPWRRSGITRPFFFAWRPYSYPDETAFCWFTNDPSTSNQRTNGMMQFSANVQGITAADG